MSILIFLVPIALLLSGGALAGFIWATKDGQFNDLDTPALRALIEEGKENE